VSVGVAELSSRIASDEALIFAAEAALDEAKRAGKDRSIGFRGPYPADVAGPLPPR
jgi:PleD family two-component response regulator